jgi:transmembrane sensor
MESPKVELSELGAELDRALVEATRPDEQVRAARDGLLARFSAGAARGRVPLVRPADPAWRRRRVIGLGVAAAMAAGVALWVRTPISFEVGGTGVPGGTDAMIAAEGGESVPLSFSEGSSVVVRPGGRVRVLETDARGAHVLVEAGAVDVAIAHRGRSPSWSFDAGPLSVKVTGTRFHLGWSPGEQRFSLALSEGTVIVSGSCVSAPRSVRAGEALALTCGAGERGVVASPGPESKAAPAPATSAPDAAVRPDPPSPAPASTAGGEKSWRELLKGGEAKQALAAAKRADFQAVLATASQAELLGLADGARVAGETDQAVTLLTTLRRRFPGTANAAAAAFSLGRIAFERRGAYSEAVRWFSTYLDEAPNGPLMGDAVGRLMESRYKKGDRKAARADAEQYLRRFPRGPYASLATRVLNER